jgi:hypothetical protein
MNNLAQYEELFDLCRRLEIEVRREHLGGDGGGLCTLKGRRVLFVDLDADQATQFHQSTKSIGALPEIDDLYLSPALRDTIRNTGN